MDRYLPLSLRSLLQRLEVNRAVGYLLLSRGWQVVSGIVSQFLMIYCLDESTTGDVQLFTSLIGMQVFVELGLPAIVALLTSHEWAQLRFDANGMIEGTPAAIERLAGLHRFTSRWFLCGAALFLMGLSVKGYYEIGAQAQNNQWLAPWLSFVCVNAASLVFMPRLSILEGCQQVHTINYFRLWQAITGTFVVWVVLLCGGGLWFPVASSLVRFAWEYYIVQIRYRTAFRSLEDHHIIQPISWFAEMWPLSWRSAIQAIGCYYTSPYFTRVIEPWGRAEVGRFGLTWGILLMMHSTALSWINTRTPEYGMLAARSEHRELRRMMWKTGLISLSVFLAGATAFLLLMWGLRLAEIPQALRYLELRSIGLLIGGLVFVLIANVFQIYVRVYKRDPFVVPNTIHSIVTAFLAWECGKRYGSVGVGAAYIAMTGGWLLPVSAYLAVLHHRSLFTPSQTEPAESP